MGWLVQLVITRARLLHSLTATRLLLRCSHSYLGKKRKPGEYCAIFMLLRLYNFDFYLTVQHGASVNLSNAKGNTALHEAVIGKNEALVDLLLQHGAVTHIRNGRNCTPADCAEPVSAERPLLTLHLHNVGNKTHVTICLNSICQDFCI